MDAFEEQPVTILSKAPVVPMLRLWVSFTQCSLGLSLLGMKTFSLDDSSDDSAVAQRITRWHVGEVP
jgi:hypothetical protein